MVVLLLLAGAIWWGVPALLKSQLPPRLSQALGRSVSLGEVQFHPLQMALVLQGLRIAGAPGADAQPQLELDKLEVDLGLLQSLRHRAPVVESLAIDGLRVRLARTAAGRYDIDDLIQRFNAPADAQPGADAARFALYNLSLRGAQLQLDDRPVGRVHAVTGLTLTLPFLSNLPGDVAIRTEPRLAFQLNGTAFDTGSHALPFSQTRSGDMNLRFADLDLAPWLPYLPGGLPVQLQRGRLATDLQLQFALPPQGPPMLVLKGRIGLRDLALATPDGAPLAAWQTLALELRDVQPLARRVGLGPLQIDGLVLDVARDAQGRLNLQRLQPAGVATPPAPPAAAATAKPDTGWQIELAGVQLNGAQVRWRDASLRPATAYTLADLSLQLQALRWPAPALVPVTLKATLHQGLADGSAAATVALDGQAHDRQAKLSLALDVPELAMFAPYAATALQPRIGGKLALQAQLAWAADPAALSITLDSATLQNLQFLTGQGRAAPPLAGLRRLQLGGAVLDLQARQVSLGRLQIDQPTLALARGTDGQIDLSAWLPATNPAPAVPATPARPAIGAAAPAAAWQLKLQDLALNGGRIAWTDAAAKPGGPPLRIDIADLKLRLQGLSWPAPMDQRAALPRLQLSASLGAPALPGAPAERGQIDWNGRFGLAPLQAEGRLQLDRLPLHQFVAYAGDALPAMLLHADASLALQLRARSTPGGWQLASDGDLRLTELMLHTRPTPGDSTGSALLSWQSLALQGVSVAMAPADKPRIAVRELALTDFYSRLVITEQGRFNLQDMAATPPAGSASAPAAAAASAPAAVADSGLPIDLVLGQTVLRNGRVDFSDRFIRPNYSARLTELNGVVGTIQSGTREMATISLKGRAADTALLDISGQINPTVQPLALDIRAKATDLELAPLSPYAGKYAGYAIERGKLSMDVAYKIDPDGKLQATNQVVLNQLTFGERVDSPSATQLPVLLAVALLKDRNGVIDINLPVSGTVGDPQFSVGGIIWKVILNLLGKALTAPFALLSGGGADDLSQVQFKPGTALLADSGRQALAKVATALTERPSLTMTVTGAADTVSERDAARQALLEERLAAEARRERLRNVPTIAGAAATAAAAPASGASSATALVPLPPAERAAALKRLYQQTPLPDQPRNLVNQPKDIAPAEMEARLLAGIRITDESMRELALQRGLAVRDALIASGLPSARLFLAAPRLRLSGDGDAAWLPSVNLTLSAK